MAGQAGAGTPPWTEAVSWVDRRMPEGAQELWPLVGMGQDPEAVQRAQRVRERGSGRSGDRPDPQGGVVG